MDELVEGILQTLGRELHPDFLEASRTKVARYIETLASTGKRDLRRLLRRLLDRLDLERQLHLFADQQTTIFERCVPVQAEFAPV